MSLQGLRSLEAGKQVLCLTEKDRAMETVGKEVLKEGGRESLPLASLPLCAYWQSQA